MACVCQRSGPGTAVLLLQAVIWAYTGAIEPAPKIDGQRRSSITLRENDRRRFDCRSEAGGGWDPRAPALLTWYLNGERQRQPGPPAQRGRLVMTSSREEERPGAGAGAARRPAWRRRHSNGTTTFALRARKWDRELVCAATAPGNAGRSYNATVTLNVQFRPEILRVNAHYSQTADPGLSLVLFALVRSNPPASLTFVDQSGQPLANASDFLVLDSRSYPWLTNHTLRLALGSQSGNVSLKANNSVGVAQTDLSLTEFLQSRVEVPMMGIVTGGAVAFITLLILTLLLLCLLHKNKGKNIDDSVQIVMAKKSDSASMKVDLGFLPRENMSLPSNVPLNNLHALCEAQEAAKEEEEEDLSAAYAARGFARYPMVGYIYKVNSMSSDEIWL